MCELERFENEGGPMALLRKNTEIFTNGLRFVYNPREDTTIDIYNAEGTLNYIDSFKSIPLDTQQDFEVEVAFWLKENNVI